MCPSWCLLSSHNEDSNSCLSPWHTGKPQIGFKAARGSRGTSLECCHQLLVSYVLSILGSSGSALSPSCPFSCLTPLIKARSVAVFIQATLKHIRSDSDCSSLTGDRERESVTSRWGADLGGIQSRNVAQPKDSGSRLDETERVQGSALPGLASLLYPIICIFRG